jgi:hypothetical protein
VRAAGSLAGFFRFVNFLLIGPQGNRSSPERCADGDGSRFEPSRERTKQTIDIVAS